MSATDKNSTLITRQVVTLQQTELVGKEWQETLSSTPGILQIMGRCLMLASVPNACQVCFTNTDASYAKNPNMIGASLPASIFECCQLGEKAFYEAHTGMTKINMYAENILPSLDKICKFIDETVPAPAPSQTLLGRAGALIFGSGSSGNRDPQSNLLSMHIKKLEKCGNDCFRESEAIEKKFKAWTEFTTALISCVQGRQSNLNVKQGETQESLDKQKKLEETLDAAKQRAADRLRELQQVRDKVNEEADAQHERGNDLIMNHNWLDLVPQLAGAKIAIGVSMKILASTSVHTAERELAEMKAELEKQDIERQTLVHEMETLQEENTSLEEVVKVLKKALIRLQELLYGIRKLALYFSTIGTFVKLMAEKMSDEDTNGGIVQMVGISTALQVAGDSGTQYNVEIRDQTIAVKSELLVMGNISRAYTHISHDYILPGFFIVNTMSIPELRVGSDTVERKALELERYNREATQSIKTIVGKAQGDLRNDLQQLVSIAAAPIFGDGER